MEIGFILAQQEQGQGYATEAVRGLLDHAFTEMHMHRVVALTDAPNTAPAELLVRVGTRQEADLVDNVFFKGEWGSELLFAKLAREPAPTAHPAQPTAPTAPTVPTQEDPR